jgi:hypothetical protein
MSRVLALWRSIGYSKGLPRERPTKDAVVGIAGIREQCLHATARWNPDQNWWRVYAAIAPALLISSALY